MYTWSSKLQRYLKDGESLSITDLRAISQESIGLTSSVLDNLVSAYVAGDERKDTFKRLMKEFIKEEQIRQYMLGVGGYGRMQYRDWGRIGRSLRSTYASIDDYATRLREEGWSEAQIANFNGMYSSSSRALFERAVNLAAERWGADEELWEISPTSNNCGDCVELAAAGWKPLNTFPEPGNGSTVCGGNCHCTKLRRNSTTGEEFN